MSFYWWNHTYRTAVLSTHRIDSLPVVVLRWPPCPLLYCLMVTNTLPTLNTPPCPSPPAILFHVLAHFSPILFSYSQIYIYTILKLEQGCMYTLIHTHTFAYLHTCIHTKATRMHALINLHTDSVIQLCMHTDIHSYELIRQRVYMYAYRCMDAHTKDSCACEHASIHGLHKHIHI